MGREKHVIWLVFVSLLVSGSTLRAQSGFSLKYGLEEFNADVVSLIHTKGYGIMVWYINEPEDIAIAWNAQPDFIKTDNADFKNYIPAR
jgi:hypothetical protein